MSTFLKSIKRFSIFLIIVSFIFNDTLPLYALRPSAFKTSNITINRILQEASVRDAGWLQQNAPNLVGKLLVTCSMECAIYEFPGGFYMEGDPREANTQGGLGIYDGDKLEGLSAIGISGLGFSPLYAYRRYQVIRGGKQVILYRPVSYQSLIDNGILRPVFDKDGRPLELISHGWDKMRTSANKPYNVKVYTVNRGGTPLLLFYCPEVFDILYTMNRNDRFLQETIFGDCVNQIFEKFGILPDMLHCNEGHVADVIIRLHNNKGHSKIALLYTNHSIVPGTLEAFDMLKIDGGDPLRVSYIAGLTPDTWSAFVAETPDGRKILDFSRGLLEECDVPNCVSDEHARVTSEQVLPHDGKKFVGILNGSGGFWVMNGLRQMEAEGRMPTAEELEHMRLDAKKAALEEIRKRTFGTIYNVRGEGVCEEGVALDIDKPTLWLIRRLADYKSQYPVLRFLVHILCADRDKRFDKAELLELWYRDCPDLLSYENQTLVSYVLDKIFGEKEVVNGLGMQVVVGGIGNDYWIERFVSWMETPELKGRFAFAPNSDTELLKAQAIGSDICMNSPLPGSEACGTSDQRSARNGGINLATRSGGPPEYIEDGKSGFLVGPYKDNTDFHMNAPSDFLKKLITLSDMYYNKASDERWLRMSLEAYRASSQVTAVAMEKRYAVKSYQPSLAIRAEKISKSMPPAEHLFSSGLYSGVSFDTAA